ncbi:sensor histidine kinase [Marinobacterium sediminicola]|uniref:histidine kinase n=1 Tax=Marinobacterium sediminicola TaxID=518898 RepID=A0ABY1RWM3_9GAMM|nr:HAMP domain-containing sensor histidine kinase [Marinobacterium sediminicola]ULG70349.1 HAMP domain-containing histidine kinase [Marinobacterium sediminicola]SMR69657.1 two-component system, NtrC family, sensor histidine kinase GlrK [Marinobacterium sediminicola]
MIRLKWHTHSLKQLVLLAFFLAAIPLAILIFQSGNALVDQSERGRSLAREMLQSSQQTEELRILAEDITRAARQFEIVKRSELLDRLELQLESFRTLLKQLNLPESLAASALELGTLLNNISQQAQNVTSPHFTPDDLDQLITLTQNLIREIGRSFNYRLTELEQQVKTEQLRTALQATALMLVSMILILFFSARINRPVQQLIQHIRALGEGERNRYPRLSGPVELVQVNEQLNWLAERLIALEEDKARFLRHISHELKTPLTTLREGADILSEELAGPLTKNQSEIVNLLRQNSITLQELIEQLLDYNRLQQPHRLQIETIVLKSLLDRIITPFQLQIDQKKLKLELELNNIHGWNTDAHMLQRIVANLISNAVHYSDQGGTICISACQKGSVLELEVANTGPQIPETDIPQLFEPFYQGKNRRRGPLKGSGIGLSIASQASTALGAKLKVSRNSDGWVAFSLFLPSLEH